MLYVFFWVIPRRLNFICRRFGTLCLFHLHRQVGKFTYLPMKMGQCVPKRRHIKFRRRGIAQKKTYDINAAIHVFCCLTRHLSRSVHTRKELHISHNNSATFIVIYGTSFLRKNGYRVFPGGKERPGRDTDPSSPSSAVVMKE